MFYRLPYHRFFLVLFSWSQFAVTAQWNCYRKGRQDPRSFNLFIFFSILFHCPFSIFLFFLLFRSNTRPSFLFFLPLLPVWLLSSRVHKFHFSFFFCWVCVCVSTCSIRSVNASIFIAFHSIEIYHSKGINPFSIVVLNNRPIDVHLILNNGNLNDPHEGPGQIPIESLESWALN